MVASTTGVKLLVTNERAESERPAASGPSPLPTSDPHSIAPRVRLKQLDLLRAIAVLLVLCAHVPSFQWLVRCGWIGVDLFFVPASVLLMLVTKRGVPIKRLLAEIFFVQNYYGGIWGHTWSLCVEEHFYLLLTGGLYCLYVLRKREGLPFAIIPKLTLGVCLIALVARLLTHYLVIPFDYQTHFKPTHLRIDSLLFGVCLAYFHHFKREQFAGRIRRYTSLILVFSLAAIVPSVFLEASNAFMSTIGFTLLYLGFGGILLLLIYSDRGRLSSVRFLYGWVITILAWIGAYSYSIYLWHLLVASVGLTFIRRAYSYGAQALLPSGNSQSGPHYLIEFALYVVMSVVIGIVMSKLVEMPVLRIRDRYFPARS